MNALVFDGPSGFRLEGRGEEENDEGWVTFHPRYVGVCGTDLHIVHGLHARAKPPLVLGHEVVGTVASGALAGGSAVLDPVVGCDECPACRRGEPQTCPRLRLIGVDSDGGLRSSMSVRQDRLHPIPAGVSLLAAVLAEPLAVAVHAVRGVGVSVEDSVVVLGCGPVGLLLGACLRAMGNRRTWFHDISESRRQAAAGYGFELLEASAPAEDVARRTHGGADVVFDAAGVADAAANALSMVRAGGAVGVVGVHQHPALMDLQRVTLGEIRLVGTRALRPADLDDALALLAGNATDLEPFITQVEPWQRVAQAVEALAEGVNVKTVIECPSGA